MGLAVRATSLFPGAADGKAGAGESMFGYRELLQL
jgi:hypothetical protein